MGATAPITVGIPVYNGEEHLPQAVEGILAQTFTDFQLVIADNASTDASAEIAEGYARQDDRVTVVRHEANMGGAANWSWLAARAETPMFKWASSDDLCAPTMLEQCLQVLDDRPDAVLAYPDTVMVDADGVVQGLCRHRVDIDNPDPAVRVRQVGRHFFHANAIQGLIRTWDLQQTSLIKPWPSSDFTTLVELALRGTFVLVPEALFYRRHAPTSVGLGSLSRSQIQEWFQPGAATSHLPPEWRIAWKNHQAISRATLSPRERIRCHAYYREARTERIIERGLGLVQRAFGATAPTLRDIEDPLPADPDPAR